jgi:hypothetical protein
LDIYVNKFSPIESIQLSLIKDNTYSGTYKYPHDAPTPYEAITKTVSLISSYYQQLTGGQYRLRKDADWVVAGDYTPRLGLRLRPAQANDPIEILNKEDINWVPLVKEYSYPGVYYYIVEDIHSRAITNVRVGDVIYNFARTQYSLQWGVTDLQIYGVLPGTRAGSPPIYEEDWVNWEGLSEFYGGFVLAKDIKDIFVSEESLRYVDRIRNRRDQSIRARRWAKVIPIQNNDEFLQKEGIII